MKANKILFITQEMTPYVEDSEIASLGRKLPQAIQEKGREIRTFMPKWGHINERRNQLHEVIRLSGMNLIIDDTDHPLIIKVASIPSARMQVYFIDNDDYLTKRMMATDENGEVYTDNGESRQKAPVGTRHYSLSRLDVSSCSFIYKNSL